MNLIDQTKHLLDDAIAQLRVLPNIALYIEQLVDLKNRLEKPCVLAIAGKVKAGKSSFLNTLLGENLAKVGELETTATINKFVYGKPENPSRPVKVVWDNGTETYETKDFMDLLQSNDPQILKKAENISYLEFKVEKEILKEIILVDTPGSSAVVDEHQKEFEKFFQNLRDKHANQTNQEVAKADAVIYLLGAVANATNKTFLDDFLASSINSSPLNAIGILAKVDIDEVLLKNRKEQANYVANSLKEQLYTVIPISAGLYEVLKKYEKEFSVWQLKLKTIPPKAFEYFMRQDTTYLSDRKDLIDALYRDSINLPLSLDERKQMLGEIPWSIFRTIAKELYTTESVVDAISHLYDYANIDEVRDVINKQYFNRSKIIRSNSILIDMRNILLNIHNKVIYDMQQDSRHYDEWKKHLSKSNLHPDILCEISNFISKCIYSSAQMQELEYDFNNKLLIPLENLMYEIKQIDKHHRMMLLLLSTRNKWEIEEYEELCVLFGLYGDKSKLKIDRDIHSRIIYWQTESRLLSEKDLRDIATHAVNEYINVSSI